MHRRRLPADGSYHVGALMDDALQVLDAAGPTGRDVVIGHDWGAMTAAGLAAMPDSPFAKSVIMSVPPFARVSTLGSGARSDPAGGTRSAATAAQLVHHVLPIALASRTFRIPGGADCCGGSGRRAIDEDEDVRLVEDAIGAPENWRAAISMYRQNFRGTKPPAEYAELHRHCLAARGCPSCICTATTMAVLHRITSPGSSGYSRRRETLVVEGAGHFLQLEQPDVVARHIVDFIGRVA